MTLTYTSTYTSIKMRSTYNLKETKKDGLTSIRFIAFFKNENKKLVYSTGERIHPEDWDFERKEPKHLNGRTQKANEMRSIKTQLDRYSTLLTELENINGSEPNTAILNHESAVNRKA